ERKPATIDDLYRVEGKAELVGGEIVHMSPSGDFHGSIAGFIYVSLRQYSLLTCLGRAFPDNTAFLCHLPNRQSFAPDVSFYLQGQPRAGRKFLPEPPVFAVEIRSEHDYGPRAEKAMAEKRADYFAAGTLAVWDVDPDGPAIVRLYLHTQPDHAIAFQKNDIAHAEPVLPGWQLPVNDILDELN
ncbi:MAG: Uma2 family endonuclease, partial [bacterium]